MTAAVSGAIGHEVAVDRRSSPILIRRNRGGVKNYRLTELSQRGIRSFL
jgi:hypothetical protein